MEEHIDFPGGSALKVRYSEKPCFNYPLHFHPEIEILYIVEGSGTRFVADSIEGFVPGELVIIGENVPHFWRSDERYISGDEKLKVKYFVIQFPGDFLFDEIKKYPEYLLIDDLLKRISRGICFTESFSRKMGVSIKKIWKSSGFERIIRFQELLYQMAKTSEFKYLAGEFYQVTYPYHPDIRLSKIIQFLNSNYLKKIELEEVALFANLHPTAFCRFFREKTGKTFIMYLNELRIGYACKLILDNKLQVSQIATESGFNNMSNFNRIFKKHTHLTPSEYYAEFNNQPGDNPG